MKRLFPVFILSLLITSCSVDTKNVSKYVDPFIGTGGHGHTYPGASMPFGMMQLSPDTRIDSWDGCSGYHYSDGTILGFSHTHLSGTGVGDYGDIRFMPTVGDIKMYPGTEENPESGYRSRFSHETEVATPGYYAVTLEDYNIDVELTVDKRAGIHKYTFPAPPSEGGSDGANAHVIIDLLEGVTTDKILYLDIEFLGDTAVRGTRSTQGWANKQSTFFYAVFSEPFSEYAIIKDGQKINDNRVYGSNVKAYVSFDFSKKTDLMVRVGISGTNYLNAAKNLWTEIPDFKFKKTKNNARRAWNDALGKIEVEGGTDAQKTIFYTSLYHALLNPNLFSDVSGDYRGHDHMIHEGKGFDMYTVFSLWDTFRAEHPLLTIIEPDRTNDFILSMLDMYKKGGLLPVWELNGNETNCMIGYHSIPVIYDAYMKGIRDYDLDLAFRAMKESAMQDHFGLEYYKEYGYIPADLAGSSVSMTLEYAYDDWCIAQMAKKLGKDDDYKYFTKRAQYYKNIYDPSTGFMRGKRNGSFVVPFDPTEVNFMLTEANTWQYNFFVPQDVNGMIDLMGGDEAFTIKLDSLFNTSSEMSGRHQSDITGLIGQYAHGNEPSHHMAYLYNYSGYAWKAQEVLREIMDELYTDQPDGLCGNEDCGQMSAWYVLSAMGFYPVTPGDNQYILGTPIFDKVTINLDNGKKFVIKANKPGPDNYYVQSVKLNGADYTKSYFVHRDILNGGELEFVLGPEPNKAFGAAKEDRPMRAITEHVINPVPYISNPEKTFMNEMEFELKSIDPAAEIFYSYSGAKDYKPYEGPIKKKKSFSVYFYAEHEEYGKSMQSKSEYIRIPEGRTITIKDRYDNQYTGGGDIGLINYQKAGTNWRTGDWQGYHAVDLDAIIDLGKREYIRNLSLGALQDQKSWIFMPTKVIFEVSNDKKNWTKVGEFRTVYSPMKDGAFIHRYTKDKINRTARYIRVFAENLGTCPEGHLGEGNPAWLFVDEVGINE